MKSRTAKLGCQGHFIESSRTIDAPDARPELPSHVAASEPVEEYYAHASGHAGRAASYPNLCGRTDALEHWRGYRLSRREPGIGPRDPPTGVPARSPAEARTDCS